MILGLKINFTLRKRTDNCGSQENTQHNEFENKIKNDLQKEVNNGIAEVGRYYRVV